MPISQRQRAKNQQLVSDVFESLAPKIENQFSDQLFVNLRLASSQENRNKTKTRPNGQI